ncbi:MAG: hypothetical protein ACK5IQ_04455, partial [Bacteroidales bacterium]
MIAESGTVLRRIDLVKVRVDNSSATNVSKGYVDQTNPYWYLVAYNGEKDDKGLPIRKSLGLRGVSVNMGVEELARAAGISNVYGEYKLEVYGSEKEGEKEFAGSDTYSFSVKKNRVVEVSMPKNVPVGAIIKPVAPVVTTIFENLLPEEKIVITVSADDIDSGSLEVRDDGSIGILKPSGEEGYKLRAKLVYRQPDHINLLHPSAMESDIDSTEVEFTVNASYLEFEKALWSYANGQKRFETGFGEESYAYVKLKGAAGLKATIKVYMQPEFDYPNYRSIGDTFSLQEGQPEAVDLSYNIADTALFLEEQRATFDGDDNLQIKINTENYRDKAGHSWYRANTRGERELNAALLFSLTLADNNEGAISISGKAVLLTSSGELLFSILGEYFLLTGNERMILTDRQVVKKAVFSNTEKTHTACGTSASGYTHDVWVQTSGMVGRKLTVVVYRELSKEESVESYDSSTSCLVKAAEETRYEDLGVPANGLLEAGFTIPERGENDDGFAYYTLEVFEKQEKDGEELMVCLDKGYNECLPAKKA